MFMLQYGILWCVKFIFHIGVRHTMEKSSFSTAMLPSMNEANSHVKYTW